MAWWTMIASVFAALLALLLCCERLALFGVGASDVLGLLGAKLMPQKILGLQSDSSSGGASTSEEWDTRYHMGGNSPWMPRKRGSLGSGIEPPAGCRVDQVHLVGLDIVYSMPVSDIPLSFTQISRHAERYPTILAGISMPSPNPFPPPD